MSKIEDALEKAAQQRNSKVSSDETTIPRIEGRIEKALEKAAQLRNEAEPSKPVEPEPVQTIAPDMSDNSECVAAPPLAPSTTRQPPPRTVTINSDNRLLPTISDQHSAVSEQYRKLKSALVRMTNEDRFRNLIMITSAIAGEGKSLTAANLAISMAQEYDLTVLLVDADLRRPSIHEYLGFEQTTGLSDCLLDGTDVSEVMIKTNINKLTVIPAGREVSKPLELFASKKMQNLMEEIKHRYNDRYVIIDTPPLLLFAETRSLARIVDGVILVVHEGVVPQKDVVEAKEILKGCPILGVVLNDSTEVKTEQTQYSRYYRR